MQAFAFSEAAAPFSCPVGGKTRPSAPMCDGRFVEQDGCMIVALEVQAER